MSNRLFFLLAAVSAGLMIFLAMAPFRDVTPRGSVSGGGLGPTRLEITGRELHRLLPGEQDKVEILETSMGEVARIQTSRDDVPGSRETAGAYFQLAADLEVWYGGRRIAVSVEARAAKTDAPKLFVIYSAGKVGASGWKTFPLTPEFRTYGFEYSPPVPESELGTDFIGLRAGAATLPAAIEIRKVTIELLG